MATAVEEPIWTAEGARKRAAVRRMFAEIAPTYDLLNGVMSLSRHRRWREQAVALLRLEPGEAALDLCCGTGDFFAPLRGAVGTEGLVAGIDFCRPMLEIARTKKGGAGLSLADACRIPVRDASLDAVTVGWGIRNVPDIDAAHREIARVLRPGGRFVSLDMAVPRNRLVRQASKAVLSRVLPWLGSRFGKTEAYTYLPKSTQRFWTREQLQASMESAGMVEVAYRDLMFGNVCLHYGRKPSNVDPSAPWRKVGEPRP